MTNLALPRLTHGSTCGITSTVLANATSIPTDSTSWPTSPAFYPMALEIGGEIVQAGGVTGSPQVFTGVQRALNGVSKSHLTGTRIDVASPIRGSLGNQSAPIGAPNPPINPPVPPGTGTPAPTIPAFSSTPTVITTAQNAATVVAAGVAGQHFLMAAGTHTLTQNVLLKANMHIRLAPGCIIEGAGKGYCFRPQNSTTTGVVIGGDPSGARPIIRNFGNGTTHQHYGAIMGRTDDPLGGGGFDYIQVENWFIYHLDFEKNSANGIVMGDYFTIYDCEFHGHKVTGVSYDRGCGGLVWGNLFYWNALDPASGNASNGAHLKATFLNGGPGRTAVTPTDRAKAQMIVSHNRFEAVDRDGGVGFTEYHLWFDLDCQQTLVEYNSFFGSDLSYSAVLYEGANNGVCEFNDIHDFRGYGPAYDADFTVGAVTSRESTNLIVRKNTFTGCDWTLLQGLSNRTYDWYRPTQTPDDFVNFAWSAGPRYWILDTEAIPALDGNANMWTGANDYDGNVFVDCLKIVISEGRDGAFGGVGSPTQIVHGKTPLATIKHRNNNYTGSPSIQFYLLSNSPLTLAGWLATGRQ